jgi:hypothetical protein
MASSSRIVVPGRIVHYVREDNDYECPAMISGTPESMVGADDQPEEETVHLHVFDPADEEETYVVEDAKHDRQNKPASWHWQDECRRT